MWVRLPTSNIILLFKSKQIDIIHNTNGGIVKTELEQAFKVHYDISWNDCDSEKKFECIHSDRLKWTRINDKMYIAYVDKTFIFISYEKSTDEKFSNGFFIPFKLLITDDEGENPWCISNLVVSLLGTSFILKRIDRINENTIISKAITIKDLLDTTIEKDITTSKTTNFVGSIKSQFLENRRELSELPENLK